MNGLGICFARLEKTGKTKSKIPLSLTSRPLILSIYRFKAKLRSGELLVPGDQWPLFIYAGQIFSDEDPWKGLFRSKIMVQVMSLLVSHRPHFDCYLQSFKHVFTSPSSVENENKATRSGNARIHGMTRVTPASIAYIATQVGSWSLSCLSTLTLTRIAVSGSICTQFFCRIFQKRYHHRLRNVL